MKMKNLLLSALIFAMPAWAGEAAPDGGAGVSIVLKGSAKGVHALLADLEKEAMYQEAACSSKPAKKNAKSVKISCAKADGALLAFLGNKAPANIHWSISAAPKSASTAMAKGVAPMAYCPPPVGCAMIKCPPPSGPLRCCNTATYAPC